MITLKEFLKEPTNISSRIAKFSKGIPRVKTIVGGDLNTAFLLEDGTLLVSSAIVVYEYDQDRPIAEPCYQIFHYHNPIFMHHVKKVIFSKYNILILLEEGSCLVCGGGEMLGLHEDRQVQDFQKISLEENDERVEDVIVGHFHVILKSSKRRLYSFGCNRFGELESRINLLDGIMTGHLRVRITQPHVLQFECRTNTLAFHV